LKIPRFNGALLNSFPFYIGVILGKVLEIPGGRPRKPFRLQVGGEEVFRLNRR